MYKIFLFILAVLIASCKNEEKKSSEKAKIALTGDPAIDKLSIEIDRDPLNPKLRYERALKLYGKNMLDECIEDMRIAITTDSLNADYYHLVADAFLDNNLSSKALQSMEKAAKLFPNRIPTLLKYAEFQHILKQSQAGILTCNEVIRLDPQNAEAYFMLGTILNDIGETQRAINSFQTATEMDEKLTDAWISLGNLFAKNKDKKAIQYYQNAIDIDPRNSIAKQALAFFYQENGDVDQALKIYEEIITSDPNHADAYFNSGILHIEKKQYDLALEKFNILIGIAPQDGEAYYYRGLIYKETKQYDKAISDFQNAQKILKNKEGIQELVNECNKLATHISQK